MPIHRGTALVIYDAQHEDAVERILNAGYYIEDYAVNQDAYDSEFLSIARWTLNELCVLVETHISEPPLKILDDFRNKFERFSKNCTNANNVYFCEWVLDVTDFVIDRFM